MKHIPRIKIEMHGTGGGRWCPRETAKRDSRKARRVVSKILERETEPPVHPAEARLIDADARDKDFG